MDPAFSIIFISLWIGYVALEWRSLRRQFMLTRIVIVGFYSLSLLLFILQLNNITVKTPADVLNEWISPWVRQWIRGGGVI